MHVDGFLHSGTLILSFLFFTQRLFLASALYVIGNSNCTTVCQTAATGSNGTLTTSACHDSDYNSTAAGVSFRQCVGCELESEAYDQETGQTDLGWALYNMRSTLDQCLYNQSQVASSAPVSACVGLCAPIKDSIEINLDSPDKSSPYQHCVNPTFVQNATSCAKCYAEETNDQIYLSNFLNTLAKACKPIESASPSLPGNVFSTEPSDSVSNEDSGSGGGMSRSAGVAIAIAVPVGVFLILSFCLVLIFVRRSKRGRRRRPRRLPKRVSSPIRYHPSHYQPPRQINLDSSRETSNEQVQVPTQLRQTPERIPLPRPLQAKKSGHLSTESRHPAYDENTAFEQRIDLQGPTTTPNEPKSEDENYAHEVRYPRQARVAALRENEGLARGSRSRTFEDVGRRSLHPSHIGKSAIPLSTFNQYKESHLRPPSTISEIPSIYTADAAEMYSPRRLLAGSPFNAPSLVASGAASRAATSVSTKRTPSNPSSKKHPSDATITSQKRTSQNSLRKTRSGGSTNQLEQAIPPPTPRDRGFGGFPMKTITEKVNDPALSRAKPPSPPPLQRSAAKAASFEPLRPEPFSFYESEAEPVAPRESESSIDKTRTTQLQYAPSEGNSAPMFSPSKEQVNDPALQRAVSSSARVSGSEFSNHTSWGAPLEPQSAFKYKFESDSTQSKSSTTRQSTNWSGSLVSPISQDFQRLRASSPVSPGTIPLPTLEPVREEPRVQRPSSPVSPGTLTHNIAHQPQQTHRPSSPVSPRTMPVTTFPRPSSSISPKTNPFSTQHRPSSQISPTTLPHPLFRPQHLSAPPQVRPDSDISPKTLPASRFPPPSPYHHLHSRNRSIDSSLMLSLSSSSNNSPSTVNASTFPPPPSSSTAGASAYFTPWQQSQVSLPEQTAYQRGTSPPSFMISEGVARVGNSPIPFIRGAGVVMPREELRGSVGEKGVASSPEGGFGLPSKVMGERGMTKKTRGESRGKRLGDQEQEMWKVRWKGREDEGGVGDE